MYLLFDIGGTNTRIAFSEDGQRFSDPVIFKTEKENFKNHCRRIQEEAQKLAAGRHLEGAAGGIAGPLNHEKTKLINSPNLPEWIGLPIKDTLEQNLGVSVFLENDSAIVGLGEAVRGAGSQYEIVAYVTVSTGVGGVRIVQNRIDAHTIGFEPGHQIIDIDGTACLECKNKGHLEGYIGGKSLEARFGKKPYEIHDDNLWEEEARLLAAGLNNITVLWSPEVIVLGGSMMKSPGISIAHVRKHLRDMLTIFPEAPEVKKAELGDFGGIHGALAYIKQKLSEKE